MGAAFAAELAISALLMGTVLTVSARPTIARYTGLIAGGLIACFVTFEAALYGMSMNPARSLASAMPSELWQNFWLYVFAPVLGMGCVAAARKGLSSRAAAGCAKIVHLPGVRCIHCGDEPDNRSRGDG